MTPNTSELPSPDTAWVDHHLERIDSWSKLPIGWDSYEAEPPSEIARRLAAQAIRLLDELEFRPNRVAASVEGGIAFTWRMPGKYADVEFFNTGEVLTAHHDDDQEVVIGIVEKQNLMVGLRGLREYVNG